MTRLRAGSKPGVGPVLKIMANDADDPFDTPNDQYNKFVFNSENSQISYLLGFEKFEKGGPSVYPSSGGTPSSPNIYSPRPYYTVYAYVLSGNHREDHYFDFQGAYGLPFAPYFECRTFKITDDRVEALYHSYSFSFVANTLYSRGTVTDGAARPYQGLTTQGPGGFNTIIAGYVGSGAATSFTLASVWEFPRFDDAYSLPNAPPVSGQKVISIRPDKAAMARPGFDVETATGRQFIFDSDRIPAKILAAGEIELPGNGTADIMINPAFQPLGQLTYVDAMVRYASAPYYHPNIRLVGSWWLEGPSFDYEVMTDRVRLLATSPTTIFVRYLVVADDGDDTAGTGSSPVFQGGDDIGYTQICRPGAPNPPKLRDVILDSRLPYIPIVSEGFIPNANFSVATDNAAFGTHRAADVTFANSGFIPFVKYSTVSSFNGTWFGGPPIAHRFYNDPNGDNWNSKHAVTSTIARVEDAYVRFYASPNNPSSARWVADPNGTPPNPPIFETSYIYDFVGVRYYILAIPNPV